MKRDKMLKDLSMEDLKFGLSRDILEQTRNEIKAEISFRESSNKRHSLFNKGEEGK